jgi:hypothetical protein
VYRRSQSRDQVIVGLGFGVFNVLAPLVCLCVWLASDWRTAVEWGSWCALIGIAMMVKGYLLGRRLMKYLMTLTVEMVFPAAGFAYVYGNGNTWAWVLGWSLFGFAVAESVRIRFWLRQPSVLSYEYARSIMTGGDVPYHAKLMMVLVTWVAMFGLGTFLVLANVGLSGHLVTMPLGVVCGATVLYVILFIRYRKALLSRRGS